MSLVNTSTSHCLSEAVAEDGVSIAYEDLGYGEPLVLLHSLTESHESWHEAGYVEHFLQRERRLILVDCPIYVGFLLAFWATPSMTWGHLLFSVGSTSYILLGLFLEERDLVALFDDQYRRYRPASSADFRSCDARRECPLCQPYLLTRCPLLAQRATGVSNARHH